LEFLSEPFLKNVLVVNRFIVLSKESLNMLYLPEEVTSLSYSTSYAKLTRKQQIRYNQLFGLYGHELIIFFEKRFPAAYLAIAKHEYINSELKKEIQKFVEDEDRHWRMFDRLNKELAPEIYLKNTFHFLKISPLVDMLARIIISFSPYLPMLLILIFMQEERSIYYTEKLKKTPDLYHPKCYSVHLKHLEDEDRHVDLDEKVIELIWARLPRWLKKINVLLLKIGIREFFTLPKRAGIKIIDQFILEFPDLEPRKNELKKEIFNAVKNSDFYDTLYSPKSMPRCVKFLNSQTIFQPLGDVIKGINNGTLK
jgi:rubrerythrin